MDKLYTKRIVPNQPQVEILDRDGDHLTSVPPEAADVLLSHLNNPGQSYRIATATGHVVGGERALDYYEITAEDDSVVLFRCDDFMQTLAVHENLNRGA